MNWPRPYGPVKCDVTATSGITGWLQTKQTASLYKTERDIFAYISAKIKIEYEYMFLSRLQPSMFTRTLQVFFVFHLDGVMDKWTNPQKFKKTFIAPLH